MAPSEHDDDYYVVLEVTNDASFDKLRKVYCKLAKTRHPDKGGSNEAFQLASLVDFLNHNGFSH